MNLVTCALAHVLKGCTFIQTKLRNKLLRIMFLDPNNPCILNITRPLSIKISSYHNIVEAYVKWWITYFKNEPAWGGGAYCGWGCTHNNILITIDLKSDDCDCRCIQMYFLSTVVGLLIAIWSKWEWQALSTMRSSCGEQWVEMHFNGVRENSSQKLSPSIYHNPICVNLKETDFICLLKIKMGPFG